MRQATMADLDEIMTIIDGAKAQLAAAGSPQWQDGYPNRDTLTRDLEAEAVVVLMSNGRIAGTASLIVGVEPTYATVYDGEWAAPTAAYATIHRIAISRDFAGAHLGRIFFATILTHLYAQGLRWVRLDTHRQNRAMQHLATTFGFSHRGTIRIDHGEDRDRLAYEVNLGDNGTLVRTATEADLPQMLAILNEAKAQMLAGGNNQWLGDYPNAAVLNDDIARGAAKVLLVHGQVAGTASVIVGIDADYAGGDWRDDVSPYAAIHRVAIARAYAESHLGRLFFDTLISDALATGVHHFRIDTSVHNGAMQHLALALGFESRGLLNIYRAPNMDTTWPIFELAL